MNFHHFYTVAASAKSDGLVDLQSDGLPALQSAPPKEFGGPGDQWSPEDLVVAAAADCFVLSFRAIAAASKFEWDSLKCEATGELDKADGGVQFVGFKIKATLNVAADADVSRAESLLKKAKATCFITNSLKAAAELESEVVTG
jgi:peroxiredoxin-like protein